MEVSWIDEWLGVWRLEMLVKKGWGGEVGSRCGQYFGCFLVGVEF